MTTQRPIGSTTPAASTEIGRDGGTRWTRLAALTGILFVVLVVPGVLLGSGGPSTHATGATVSHYYVTHKHQVGLSGMLDILGVVAGLSFFTYLRGYFRRITGVDWLPSLFLTGGVVFAVSGLIGAGVNLTFADSPQSLSPDSLQLLNALNQNLSWGALCAGLTLMYVATGMVVVRTRILPAWLAWVSWLMALLAATFFLSFIPFIALPVWMLVVAVRMASRNPNLGTA